MKGIDSTPQSTCVWGPDPHVSGGYIGPARIEETSLIITRVGGDRELADSRKYLMRWCWRPRKVLDILRIMWEKWKWSMGSRECRQKVLLCKCHSLTRKRKAWEDL